MASYALLTHLLAAWTGLKPRNLYASLGDCHVYRNHLDAAQEFFNNPSYDEPQLVLPEKAKQGLDSLLEMTALDFTDALQGYKSCGTIKAPLSVGE